jgi:hypothetical protein
VLNHLGTTGHQWVEATRSKGQAYSLGFAFLVGPESDVSIFSPLDAKFFVCSAGPTQTSNFKRDLYRSACDFYLAILKLIILNIWAILVLSHSIKKWSYFCHAMHHEYRVHKSTSSSSV